MYDNEYFVVDMASCSSTGEIINNLSIALETLNYSGKKIVLKLNDTYLNQSQLLSIQSLITSWGCTLDTIETLNAQTTEVAQNMNILVQKPIEKRIEDKYSDDLKDMEISDIAIKEVDENRFEADLDSIQKQQEELDSELDIKNAAVNLIEDSASKEFEKSINDTAKDIFNSISSTAIKDMEIKEVKEEKDEKINLPFEEKIEEENAQDDGIKNSIGVYKKADEENNSAKDWEDVDFYESPTNDPVVFDTHATSYVNQTLRSGQILEFEGNVVVIGDCHSGSEIRATGDVTVWGVLSGIVHAGYKGNNNARVRALKLNAIQLRIGNCYSRRPDDTNIPYIIRSSVFTPEEARVVDNEIVLFKMNQK